MLRVFVLVIFALLPVSAYAFDRISDRDEFVRVVGEKDLRIGLYGLTLNVRADGTIVGRAVGYGITGTWVWENGYFCRDMDWSGYAIEYNCQLVELDGERLRFTVDRGAGDDAVFRIR